MVTIVSRCHGRTVLLPLALLAALSGCGPGPSDNTPSFESRAAVAGPEAVPLASNPAPLASENGTGSASGRGTVAGGKGDSPHAVPVPFSELVVPDWMAKDLASPDAQVRLKAVDRWAQQAPAGSVDPLIHAMEDKDERVQARALELIVQDWMRGQRGADRE